MSTDWRSLISRMADELDHYRQLVTDDRREVHPLAMEARAVLARWGRPAPGQAVEALAARPLMERVAALGDIIGEQTVGQVRALADRAAAWLAANPPGQPVAIEPRGCPTPGACSCVELPGPVAVAVSKRLPEAELCWWYEPDEDDDNSGYGGSWTLLRIRGNTVSYTHWLPAHALPLPAVEVK